MGIQETLNRSIISALVFACLENILAETGETPAKVPDEETYLIGRQAVLESLGMVTLIVDLEQRVEEEYGVALTLVDDQAMSKKNSPFMTVRSLTDHIYTLAEQEQRSSRS